MQSSSSQPAFHGHGSSQVDMYSFGAPSSSIASGSQRPGSRASPTAYGRYQQQLDSSQQIYAPPLPVSGPQGSSEFQGNAALTFGGMPYSMQDGRAGKRMRVMDENFDGEEYEAEGAWDEGVSLEHEQKPKP